MARILRQTLLSRESIKTAIAALALRKLRYFGKGSLDGPERVSARDQADRVLPLGSAAGRGGGHANEPAPLKRKIQLLAIAAGDDGAMQSGQAREPDHGIDDLLAA